jgi:RNA-directed DNA polymerase
MLSHLFYGIVVAVKRVTDNRDKKTPGVDGETWDTPEQKPRQLTRSKEEDTLPDCGFE